MKIGRCAFLKSWLVIPLMAISLYACTSNQILGNNSKTSADSNRANWQSDVTELNEKIVILTRWQQGYRMTAQQAQFKADRLQFQEQFILDAKRLWKVAENAKQKAEDLQLIIDNLVEQRNAILTRHNQPIPKEAGDENKNSIEEQD